MILQFLIHTVLGTGDGRGGVGRGVVVEFETLVERCEFLIERGRIGRNRNWDTVDNWHWF